MAARPAGYLRNGASQTRTSVKFPSTTARNCVKRTSTGRPSSNAPVKNASRARFPQRTGAHHAKKHTAPSPARYQRAAARTAAPRTKPGCNHAATAFSSTQKAPAPNRIPPEANPRRQQSRARTAFESAGYGGFSSSPRSEDTLVPKFSASLPAVSKSGSVLPNSQLLTLWRVTWSRSASCCWVSPAAFRARRRFCVKRSMVSPLAKSIPYRVRFVTQGFVARRKFPGSNGTGEFENRISPLLRPSWRPR